MDRRRFLQTGVLAFGGYRLFAESQQVLQPDDLQFSTDDGRLMHTYEAALSVLHGNITQLHPYSASVLVEGSVYPGVWLECAPQEGEVYSALCPDIARNNHMIFFSLQKEDGQLPCSIKKDSVGFGQIQMVVPIAATAWEMAQRFQDNELLEKAYVACSRWDAWLLRYRNTRGTGLCEGFCTYDTGHDNSPRWKGVPNRCPDADARKCPPVPGMPRLCPDLSATVYGGRVALAAMAKALGKQSEADRWAEEAEHIRKLIIAKLYCPEDAAFYDLDTDGHFVRIRGDVISRVLGEHVVDAKLFAAIYERQIHNPKAFWAPYPLPSIALDDPDFVRPIPRNSWGGASQALTALRAPRWMEHYGKPADLACMMQRWVEAISRHAEFRQQMDPLTGEFTQIDPGGYSPAALVFLDYVWRLSGVRQQDEFIEWNIRPVSPSGQSTFKAKVHGVSAELHYQGSLAQLCLGGKSLATVSGRVRLLTSSSGKLLKAVGTSENEEHILLALEDRKQRTFRIRPNVSFDLGDPT